MDFEFEYPKSLLAAIDRKNGIAGMLQERLSEGLVIILLTFTACLGIAASLAFVESAYRLASGRDFFEITLFGLFLLVLAWYEYLAITRIGLAGKITKIRLAKYSVTAYSFLPMLKKTWGLDEIEGADVVQPERLGKEIAKALEKEKLLAFHVRYLHKKPMVGAGNVVVRPKALMFLPQSRKEILHDTFRSKQLWW